MDTYAAWRQANRQHLIQALARIRDRLAGYVGQRQHKGRAAYHFGQLPPASPTEALPPFEVPFAVEALQSLFDLSDFEREVLLLAVGGELDSEIAELIQTAQGNSDLAYPTFGLALAVLASPDWSALAATRPLRYWELLHLRGEASLTLKQLQVDESILNFLIGTPAPNSFLEPLLRRIDVQPVQAPSHLSLVEQLANLWLETQGPWPVVQVCGAEPLLKQHIAAAACERVGVQLLAISAYALPTTPPELERFLRLIHRESLMNRIAVLLDCDELGEGDTVREPAVRHVIEYSQGLLLLISSHERREIQRQATLVYDIHKPTPVEQQSLWRDALQNLGLETDSFIARLIFQFNLTAQAIEAIVIRARSLINLDDPRVESSEKEAVVWDSCRRQARQRLDDLAERVESRATWADLILPSSQLELLKQIAEQVQQRATVYEAWGFSAKQPRGLGISALLAGPSGTGKTLAAEVLAGVLQLDLYRIDLSRVVNKYIGETEKNLRRIFDAAEAGGAVLLFDEADALFGKRSEVKDSHDRYANIEVSYLLQRLESYRGLAILTTNFKEALDSAFLRRLRFIVDFPNPDLVERARIWQRSFPAATPTAGLDYGKLAQLQVPGGNIRNIALAAAFRAAAAGQPVTMQHILQAAGAEYIKIGRILNTSETRGWS
jgi:ATP-dependent 26S proteasome regulatory subunit